MAIYMYVFLISTYFAYLADRAKYKDMRIIYSVISIMLPCVLGGLRAYGVGYDTMVYGQNHFESALIAESMADFVIGERINEIGYKFVCYTMAKLTGHVNWCYFAYQLLTVPFIYIGAWRHRDKISMPLLLFTWYLIYYCDTLNIMRQAMAAAIVFMELDKLESRQYYKFSVAIIIATLFHTSALILFGLVLGLHVVTTSEFVTKNVWLRIMITYGLMIFLVSFQYLANAIVMNLDIFSKYRHYLSSTGNSLVSAGMLTIMFGEMIMIFLYGKKAHNIFVRDGKGNFEFYEHNMILYLVMGATFAFGGMFMVVRMLWYLGCVNCIFLAALPKFVKEKHLKLLVTLAVVFVSYVYWSRAYGLGTYYKSIL